ncbi:MAG: hypothetical protein RIC35_14400 [Marinoscillum sp.]
MQVDRSYIRYILGGICAIGGILFMFIPFIPLGYILIFAALLLLAPKIPFLKKYIKKLKKRDNKGHLQRIEEQINDWEEDKSESAENKKAN